MTSFNARLVPFSANSVFNFLTLVMEVLFDAGYPVSSFFICYSATGAVLRAQTVQYPVLYNYTDKTYIALDIVQFQPL